MCVPVPFVSPHATLPPAERLARLIDGLCRAVAARGPGGFLARPVLLLLWSRLKQASTRILRLAARARAGTLPAPRAPRASPRRVLSRQPPRRLPWRAGWLLRPVPDARAIASQLEHLLAQPDMAALLAAAPGVERLLRPLCRMLGVARPRPPLRSTPRSRPAPRQPPPPAQPPAREKLARWRLRPRRAPPAPPYTPWSPDPA